MPNHKSARRDKVEIYLHLLWTAWDRQPFINPEWEADLYAILGEMAHRNKCILVAEGGIEDHVHCLVTLHATTRLCDLIHDMKGNSSKFAHEHCADFKWRPTYAAFSVSRWDVPKIKNYVRGQKEHHRDGTTRDGLENFDEEYWFDDLE